MRRIVWLPLILVVLTFSNSPPRAADPPGQVVAGLKNLRSAVIGPNGKLYVAVAGEPGKEGAGAVLLVEDGKGTVFAGGLDGPSGMAAFAENLYVADRASIVRIDKTGKSKIHVAPSAFPEPLRAPGTVVAGEGGVLYVSDLQSKESAAIYRIDPKGAVTMITNTKRTPEMKVPRGMVLDGASFLLVLDGASGALLRIKIVDGSAVKLAEGFGSGGGLAWDWFGRLYLGDATSGRVSVIPRAGDKAVPTATAYPGLGGLTLGPAGTSILVVDTTNGAVRSLATGVPGQPLDETPAPVEAKLAFADLTWTDWMPEDSKGQPVALRPIVLTHANDKSNRVFVATEHGVIHVFPNEEKANKTRVFLDIQDRVVYDDKQNEEGLLGLTFHPKYKENGEFFVFYTRKQPKLTNVLSRFRVSKDDPNKADPNSEEELLRITKPFWNHNGGTVCFGPDGYLYLAIGDGGAGNDPLKYGQNLGVLFGKVLRLDVDRKDKDLAYAIPKDNPFVGKEKVRPEIWAYGLRNPWRIAFDFKTGKLWCGEVGQGLYEEINILVAGGNYGWSAREGLHPFGSNGKGPEANFIEPIWEYHHDIGKSITGGPVYRGTGVPELAGAYLYADYVAGRLWALWYDESKGRVIANRPIRAPSVPVLSFGEDEKGEVYFLTTSPIGKGIYRFRSVK